MSDEVRADTVLTPADRTYLADTNFDSRSAHQVGDDGWSEATLVAVAAGLAGWGLQGMSARARVTSPVRGSVST